MYGDDILKVSMLLVASFAAIPFFFSSSWCATASMVPLSTQERRLNDGQQHQFASSAHACLLAYNMVQCVGYNYYGQLGQSSSTAFNTLVTLSFDSTSAIPIKVVTGYDHTCTLFNDGHIWCNGSNAHQQLGDETTINSEIPVQVKKNGNVLTDVMDIEAGAWHNCAIQNTGAMYCWGFDSDGQLGMNAIMDGSSTDKKAMKIALSTTVTCVVTEADPTSATCIGYGYTTVDIFGLPSHKTFSLGQTIDKITAGSTHFCALLVDTKAKCWGTNHKGQLGIGSAGFTPRYDSAGYVLQDASGVEVSGITDINAGYASTCLVASGNPMCFGGNKYFQLGIANGGANVVYPTLTIISNIAGKSLVSMHVGERTGHAVFSDGSIYSFGTNYGGAFGDGSMISSKNVVGDVTTALAPQMNFFIGSSSPSSVSSSLPSTASSSSPSLQPSNGPSLSPSLLPSDTPSLVHSSSPSLLPSISPSSIPSIDPDLLSVGWRVWALPSDLPYYNQNFAWDVAFIQFYSSTDCSGTPFPNTGTPIASGWEPTGNWGPANAFVSDGNSFGGRVDTDGEFYIGMIFPSSLRVGCVKFDQRAETQMASKVYVQRLVDQVNDSWENFYVGTDLAVVNNVINLNIWDTTAPTTSPSARPSVKPSARPSSLPSASPSRLPVCETFNHDGSTWRVNGNGESLSTFCSREDCCNGSGQYQCASFWSTNVSYRLCTGSCKGDRACQGIAENASSGSVSIGPLSCSSTSAGNTCKNIVDQNTGSVNVSIGAGSCLDNGCSSLATSGSAGAYVVSVGDNSCLSERSCSYAGGKNGPGGYSVSIGDNSCQSAFACWGIAYETTNISGVSVPDNECNGSDNICKFCGSGSVYTGVIEATSSCCSADGNIEKTSVDIECIPTPYTLAFNVNPSDGNNAGYYSPMWNVNSNVGSSSQALSHDYKSVSAWSQQFQCLAVARHNGAGIADGIKVWKLSTRNTLANHFQSSDRAVITSGGPVQVISESGVNYSTDPILASSGVNNNLAFNWRHANNGVRVIQTDVGHWSGTLSGETINDDDSHGIGNDLGCDHANQAASAWWHDAAPIQGDCHGYSCAMVGTDQGGEFTLVQPKLGNYAFLVSETDTGGNCPIASWYILQTSTISPSSTFFDGVQLTGYTAGQCIGYDGYKDLYMYACTGGIAQKFTLTSNGLIVWGGLDNMCLLADGLMWPKLIACDGENQNQLWTYENGQFKTAGGTKCLGIFDTGNRLKVDDCASTWYD